MITTNRNVFLGIHVTPSLKQALVREMNKRRHNGDSGKPNYAISQSLVSYQLLREALILQGHEDLEKDEVY